VSECDREASIMRRPWPTRGCCAMGKKIRICIYMGNVKEFPVTYYQLGLIKAVEAKHVTLCHML
jgi:hypothetical protein